MSLRIAFDLDGTLADMDAALAREAEGLFGRAVSRRTEPTDAMAEPKEGGSEASDGDVIPPVTKLDLTSRQTRRLWHHVTTIENFWESLDETEPGTVARIAEIAASRRWETIFLTRRPETAGATAQLQTQRWLQARGFPLPSVFVVQGSRGRIAAALGLDVVVDDRPENCLDVIIDSRARAILVWREDHATLPAAAKRLGIGTVKSVNECLDALEGADDGRSEKPGVIDRFKRIVGLGGPAAS